MISELQLGIEPAQQKSRGIVLPEANFGVPSPVEAAQMARRRYQKPSPFREGSWWWINPWQDAFQNGKIERKRKRIKVCPATQPEREAKKIADELLRPMNQGLDAIGSAMPFKVYVDGTYTPLVLPLMANTTQMSYQYTLNKYILPAFGERPLRDMTAHELQRYFSGMATTAITPNTVLKIKEVLSSVLGSAMRYDLLTKNPMLAIKVPRSKVVNKRKAKPHLTPEEFDRLLEAVAEPYATMIYVAVYSGLRVSELAGLRWTDVHADALTVDERYCRGDWSVPKTEGSSATIGVDRSVINRIHLLKTKEVEISWGGQGAKKRIKLVRADAPMDLVFQSLS